MELPEYFYYLGIGGFVLLAGLGLWLNHSRRRPGHVGLCKVSSVQSQVDVTRKLLEAGIVSSTRAVLGGGFSTADGRQGFLMEICVHETDLAKARQVLQVR